MFIPDPDCFPIPDWGQKSTGSRINDPDPQHCWKLRRLQFGTARMFFVNEFFCSSQFFRKCHVLYLLFLCSGVLQALHHDLPDPNALISIEVRIFSRLLCLCQVSDYLLERVKVSKS
jgi:hypothetical protein